MLRNTMTTGVRTSEVCWKLSMFTVYDWDPAEEDLIQDSADEEMVGNCQGFVLIVGSDSPMYLITADYLR